MIYEGILHIPAYKYEYNTSYTIAIKGKLAGGYCSTSMTIVIDITLTIAAYCSQRYTATTVLCKIISGLHCFGLKDIAYRSYHIWGRSVIMCVSTENFMLSRTHVYIYVLLIVR